ncbi:FHA domain-containing protein [Marivita sp. GX14005]|uniref:FHA domain-containing protein n=1 Tax=Marivita sp. GX14005 TaxID=2942276 RepID=UPI00201957E5|nr:FHA domain-containing protein [Marivita sp. GX14005]MCL3883323.1 hypothetical protein [Marivita sp. GX14005]
MAQTSDTLLLKILGGAQFGAEVALEPGTYTFGSGEECDLVFADALLAEAHGAVRLGEGRIEIRADGGALQTAAGLTLEPQDGAWHEIAQLDTVTAGTTRFAIAARGASWSRLETAAARGETLPPPEIPDRRHRRYLMPGALTALAAVFVIGSALLSSDGASSRIANLVGTARLSEEARVTGALEDLPFAHAITVSAAEDGRVSVRGYVENVAQRRAVRQVLSQTGSSVAPNISVIEVMENDIRGLIRARGLDLAAMVARDGTVTLSGKALSDSAVSDLADTILTQVLGVTAVRDDVRSASDILADAREMLDAARLDGPVILRLADGIAEATGVVPSAKVDNWVGFVSGYASRFAGDVPLRSFVALEGRGAPQPIVIAAGQPVRPDLGRVLGPALNESDILNALSTGPETLDPPRQDAAPERGAEVGLLSSEQIAAALVPFRAAFEADPDAMLARLGLPPGDFTARRLLAALDIAQADPEAAAAAFADLPETVQLSLRAVLEELGETGPEAAAEARAAPRGAQTPSAPPGWTSLLSLAMGNPAADLEAKARSLPPISSAPVGSTGDLAAPTQDAAPETVQDALLRRLSQTLDPSNDAPSGENITGDITETLLPPAPSAREESDARPQGSNTASGRQGGGVPNPSGAGAKSGPLPATANAFDAPFRRLIQATDLVLSEQSETVEKAGPDVRKALATLSETLIGAVRSQQAALSQGRTLLPAQPSQQASGAECWPGAPITPPQIPTVLFWLDYFSVDASTDLSQLDGPNQRILLEAALSPKRLRACLKRLDRPLADTLLRESIFLRETAVNDRFGGFLLRGIPQVDLDLVGIDFTGTRYIELRDGRLLRPGSAPDLESRIAAIGDLGVVLRVPGRYAARLFGPEIGWQIDEF